MVTTPPAGVKPSDSPSSLAQKKATKPFPWRSTPPQTMPERWELAASLARDLADPTLLYETARRSFAASLFGLSGEELYLLGLLICQQLRTNPTDAPSRESGVRS